MSGTSSAGDLLVKMKWRSQQNENDGVNQSVTVAHLLKKPNCYVKAFGGVGSPTDAGPPVIKIILQPIDRKGRYAAELADLTILVRSSRQPFLDAARGLTGLGHDPNSRLE